MRGIKTGVLGAALSCFVTNVWAEDICARAQDLTALQVAAVQQELMVAALSCNDAGLYNNFVVTYRKDLQTSDAALQAYFLRLDPKAGADEYHAYKTRLANISSIRNSSNTGAYCRKALSTFHAALSEGKTSLAAFVLAQPMAIDTSYPACGDRIPGGAMVAQLTAPVSVAPVAAAPRALPANPDAGNLPREPNGGTPANAPDTVYSARNGEDLQERDRQPYAQSRARTYRYETRDPYARDGYGTSNDYGRDPYYYYRNPYDRYWYGPVPPQYYLRRR